MEEPDDKSQWEKDIRSEDPGAHADHHEMDEPFPLFQGFSEIDHVKSCFFASIK